VYGSFSKDTTINRRLMEHLQEYLVSESNFLDVKTLISFIDKDEMRVFAKDGKTIVDLKKGATVLDFAFKIHSDIGLRADYGVVDGVRVGLGYELNNGNVVHVYTKNTITATEESLKKCITPKSHRILKKYFENYHVEVLFTLATQYVLSILSRYNVSADTFWLKMRERYTSEKEISERVIEVLRAVSETEKLLSELQLVDKEFMTPLHKMGDSFSKVWNIFSSSQKEVLMELNFLDECYLFCPFCVPTLSDSHHKGILHETQFTVHTRDCRIANKYDQESIFSVAIRKDIKVDGLIYMRIETEDVSGITYAISSVFRSLNLEIFNVENDRTNALYRLAYYQKDPVTISSYLEKLRKIPEIRNIVISKKNVFGFQPEKILKWRPAGSALES
jgi:guanosine-3',5'-bis(diphosphate) 3'-pyrophosphohydrolase